MMLDKIKQRFWNTVSSGLVADHDLEVLRKILLLNLIMILGGFFLALLSLIAFFQQDFVLAAGDCAILAFITYLFIFLRKSRNHQLVGIIGTVVTGCFYLFLIA